MMNAFGDPQKILLLGGTSEIGLAITTELCKSGSVEKVVLAGRNNENLVKSQNRLIDKFKGIDFEVLILDMEKTGTLGPIISSEFAKNEFDVVVLSTGLLPSNSDAIHDPNLSIETVQVNFLGPLEVASTALNCMVQKGKGIILNVSSVAVVRPRRDIAIYGASKAGMDYWVEAVSDSLIGTDVRMVNLRPGMVRTRMSAGIKEAPLTIDPDYLALRAIRGLHDGRSTIWAPKGMILLAILLRILPKTILRKLT